MAADTRYRISLRYARWVSGVLLVAVIGCQASFQYRLPTDAERSRNAPDSTKWEYSGNTISSVVVADDNGRFFRLPVGPKTKIEVKDLYGTTYRFYLQSLTVSDNDASLGGGKLWSGYELLNHSEVKVAVSDISSVVILSDSKASQPVLIH
jgi:hypothetical protein